MRRRRIALRCARAIVSPRVRRLTGAVRTTAAYAQHLFTRENTSEHTTLGCFHTLNISLLEHKVILSYRRHLPHFARSACCDCDGPQEAASIRSVRSHYRERIILHFEINPCSYAETVMSFRVSGFATGA